MRSRAEAAHPVPLLLCAHWLKCPTSLPCAHVAGNNLFGAAIPPKLASLLPGEEAVFTLMERIRPPIHRGRVLVRAEAPSRADTLSELGVFTAILAGPDGCEVVNEYAGHILRTKPVEADEGGVAAGFAVLDSPLLC